MNIVKLANNSPLVGVIGGTSFDSRLGVDFLNKKNKFLILISAVFVFMALGLNANYIEYICQFIAASIVGIIPITPGGVGLREFVFAEGSKLISLDAEFAVAASLVYFALYLLISLAGLYFFLKLKSMGNAL